MDLNFEKPRDGIRARFLGYMRVSKDDEITGSHTFVTQEMRIYERLNRACGEGNYDLELFRDDGVSGSPALRPTTLEPRTRKTLQMLADKIATGRYDGLIVYSQSRLFRNANGMMNFVDDVLLRHGTALLSASEEIDISTFGGRAFVNFNAIMDGMFRDTAVKRNRDAAATAKQLGYFLGQVPYGWDWQPANEVQPGSRRGIVPLEEQKEWVLFMQERYVAGWAATKIAGKLNDWGVAPPSHAARWQKKAEATQNARWAATEVYRIDKQPDARRIDSHRH